MKKLNLLVFVLVGYFANAQFDVSLLDNSNYTVSPTTVPCTLDNGTSTTCYEVTFAANPQPDDGPFCPTTTTDIGGMGIYDGATNPGLKVMQASLWTAMEADGYDIVDGSGNVRVNDPGVMGGLNPSFSYCLEATKDDDLQVTFLIPITSVDLASPNTIQAVELIGLSLDGIPINGDPPSTTSGGGPGGGGGSSQAKMPALDSCGGHHNPGGHYHWHFSATDTNNVLQNKGITEISCTTFPQNSTALFGFAIDGYPMYGSLDNGGATPTGLDACNGHFGATADYPSGVYHYHASSVDAPNLPPCLKGASVSSGNGSVSYFDSTTLSVSSVEKIEIKIYPNPVNQGYINITGASSKEIKLYDLLGRDILFKTVKSAFSHQKIDVSNLKTGVYILKIIDEEQTLTKKISIKND